MGTIMVIDELLDLVDQNDQVIGAKMRSAVYAEDLTNFRVVNAFLVNTAGKLWIPRRTKNKRMFPLCLDASMGGHVASGESYEEAFTREIAEELRIDLSKTGYSFLGALNPHRDGTSAFMRVYAIQTDTAPDYNPEDFCECFWLSPDELFARIAAGDVGKSDLPRMIRKLFVG